MDAGGAEGVEYPPITLWVTNRGGSTLLAKEFQRERDFSFDWGD